jgi:hypothetical protein
MIGRSGSKTERKGVKRSDITTIEQCEPRYLCSNSYPYRTKMF